GNARARAVFRRGRDPRRDAADRDCARDRRRRAARAELAGIPGDARAVGSGETGFRRDRPRAAGGAGPAMDARSASYLDDATGDRVIGALHGALVLAKDDCDNCAAYESQIRRLQEEGQLGDLVVGKLVLTQPGCRDFKRANPWLRELDLLPYTILYAM